MQHVPSPLALIPHLIAMFFPIPTCRAALELNHTGKVQSHSSDTPQLVDWFSGVSDFPGITGNWERSQEITQSHPLSHLRDVWRFLNHNKHPKIIPPSMGMDRKTGNAPNSLARLKLSISYRITSWKTQFHCSFQLS